MEEMDETVPDAPEAQGSLSTFWASGCKSFLSFENSLSPPSAFWLQCEEDDSFEPVTCLQPPRKWATVVLLRFSCLACGSRLPLPG